MDKQQLFMENERLRRYIRALERQRSAQPGECGQPQTEPGPETAAGRLSELSAREGRSDLDRQIFLLQLSEALRPVADADEILEIVTRMLGEHFSADHALYSQMEPDGYHHIIRHDYVRPGLKSLIGRHALSGAQPIYIQRLNAGETLVARDIFAERDLSEAQRQVYIARELTAFVTVPLVKAGRLVAFLRVQFKTPYDWTESEIQLVEEVAERTWAAVERSRAEKRLHDSEARHRLILEGVRDGIYELDLRTGLYVYMNPTQVALTGFSLEALNAMTPGERDARIHPEDRARANGSMRLAAAAADKPTDVEYRFLCGNGVYRWIRERGRIICDEQGEPASLVASVWDVSELKAIEAALMESRQQALNLVEQLKTADRNKNRFISVLSHELRNPLAAIVMGHSLLDRADSEGQRKRTRELLDRQTAQLTHLVNDLLDVSRIGENKISLNREPMDLMTVLQKILQDHQVPFAEKGVTLDARLPDAPVPVNADQARLIQTIGNLLYNALKFTQPGGRVQVTASLEPDGRTVAIQVADTGIGIDPDMLPHLFHPFSQIERSPEHNPGGLGLGLSIVKAIVELHGGEVLAGSEGIGKGAVFKIRLPLQTTRP